MKALLLAAAVNTCTATADPIPRATACDEQATQWCDVVDPHTTSTGCQIVYRMWCGMGGEVTPEAQEACLDALAHMTPDPLTGYSVPAACHATWAVP